MGVGRDTGIESRRQWRVTYCSTFLRSPLDLIPGITQLLTNTPTKRRSKITDKRDQSGPDNVDCLNGP